MQSKGIDSLSNEDLLHLEKTLSGMFATECESAKHFQSTSGSHKATPQRTLRILNAVRATKQNKQIKEQRW